jgi:O-antigen/teichoic acid export membrane protein
MTGILAKLADFEPLNKVFSIFLRLSAAVAKFFLFLYLAVKFSPAEVGQFGLVVAIISIGIIFIGGELHYVNSREIAASKITDIRIIITDQLKTHLVFYILVPPLLYVLTLVGFLDDEYFYIVLGLLICEHISQEIIRFLQFTFQPILGSFLIFFRNVSWVICLLVFSELALMELTIANLLLVWMMFSFFTVLLGLFLIRDYLVNVDYKNFNFRKMKNNLLRALPFFITALFFVLSQNVDRFTLKSIIDSESVGVFFFLASLASVLLLVVTYGVNVFLAPHAINAFRNNSYGAYGEIKKTFMWQTLIFALVAILVAIMLFDPLLSFVGKDDYIDNKNIFYVMLASNFMLLFSDFTNLDMYVRNMDREMMYASIGGLSLAIINSVVFVSFMGVLGAAVAAFFSVLCLWAFRNYFYRRGLKLDPSLIMSVRG